MQTTSERDRAIQRRARLADQDRIGAPARPGELPDLVRMTPDELKSWQPPANMKIDKQWDIAGLMLALTGHDLSMRMPPYEPFPGFEEWDPQLSAPSTHYAAAHDSGALQINTVISEDAAYINSKAELQTRIEPMFGAPWSRLSFRPWVSYWANRYLIARSYVLGSCVSGSNAWIRSCVMSSERDGSDGQWEGDSRGFKLWDDRITDDEFGHIAIAEGPDFEDVVPWEDLEVKIDSMHKDRVYWGRVRIESHADADGVGFNYVARSSVALYVNVKWAWVEQSGSQYHG